MSCSDFKCFYESITNFQYMEETHQLKYFNNKSLSALFDKLLKLQFFHRFSTIFMNRS
jgi:hypothetical protein